jgi:hypothetical protein
MNNLRSSLNLIILLIFISCTDNSEQEFEIAFKEKELSFLHLKHGLNIDSTVVWIRKPNNILMLHETFKKIGYERILSRYDWKNSTTVNGFGYVKNSLYNLIDSLEITYQDYENTPKYYKEFWERRKKENNDEAVYKVITEVKKIVINEKIVSQEASMVNDTLEKLLLIDLKIYQNQLITDEEANQFLEYLIQIGLHQSVYHWISGEYVPMQNVNWNTNIDTIKARLVERENENYITPWYPDTNK